MAEHKISKSEEAAFKLMQALIQNGFVDVKQSEPQSESQDTNPSEDHSDLRDLDDFFANIDFNVEEESSEDDPITKESTEAILRSKLRPRRKSDNHLMILR